jgi:hypothetical protein
MIEIQSMLAALGLWLLALVLGLVLGSLYFASVARSSAPAGEVSLRPGVLAWQTLQIILMMVILFAVLMILFLPGMFIISILSLLSPALAVIAVFGLSFIGLWMMIPLVFSPHGIFLFRQNALSAMLTSVRLVRFFLPGTGLFLLVTIIFYQGLGALWRTPPDTSWMALVGILGHAFISTGLLSASFFYYRSGHEFVLSLRKSVNSA